MFVADLTGPGLVSVVLTPAHRDAIVEEIEFAFESAGGLTFMLEHGSESARDRDSARELISRLNVALALLDQLGWQPHGTRESYVLEVDAAIDEFAAWIECCARAGLEYNRTGLVAADERVRASAQRLIDADLEKLRAARVIRTGFRVARTLDASLTPPIQAS
jgi:hypothetical protein